MLYNVPGRTGVNMTAETTARLAEIPNIVAIKEASGDLTQVGEILAKAGDQIEVISGDDFLTYPMMACGAIGVISVSANTIPEARSRPWSTPPSPATMPPPASCTCTFWTSTTPCSSRANPVPVKTTLGLMGKLQTNVRLPLVRDERGEPGEAQGDHEGVQTDLSSELQRRRDSEFCRHQGGKV